MARSRNISGPYELHPDTYIMSARHRPDAELQRAGHASLVETRNGETYMAYLVGRPLRNRGRCTLGRETAIQKMVWDEDDWLRTLDGEGVPTIETPAPGLPVHELPSALVREDFNSPQLPIDFQWLRTPWPEEIFSLTARPCFLRLFGRETIGSSFRQSLVARRQQSHCFSAATVVEFEPDHFQQLAGLVCYYNGTKYHYLYLSRDETVGKYLRVMSCAPDALQADAFTPASPISPAHSSAWPVRIWPGREGMRTLISSNTLKEIFARTRSQLRRSDRESTALQSVSLRDLDKDWHLGGVADQPQCIGPATIRCGPASKQAA